MPVSLERGYCAAPDVLVNVVEGQSVLLDLKSERYFGLDEVGTAMWKAMTTAPTLAAACAALEPEYDVEPDRLRHDLCDLAEQLMNQGLLQTRPE